MPLTFEEVCRISIFLPLSIFVAFLVLSLWAVICGVELTGHFFYNHVWSHATSFMAWVVNPHRHDMQPCGFFDHKGKPITMVGIRCKKCGKESSDE